MVKLFKIVAATAVFTSILAILVASKAFSCETDGVYPDFECTPGSIYPVTVKEICVPGYSKTVRNTKKSVKEKVYEMYGIPVSERKGYVLDHLISLQLGGQDSIDNLFPQRRELSPHSRDKDRIENFLKREVCKGTMTLKEAQDQIREDWVSVWDDYMENEE